MQEVSGSIPLISTKSLPEDEVAPRAAVLRSGGIAQLGERLHGMQEVSGSIPLISTKILKSSDLTQNLLRRIFVVSAR